MKTEGLEGGRSGAKAALLHHLVEAGYARIEPPLLHKARTFIDFGGEDMRTHLYLTSDASGEELCLRPELTIPAAYHHLASPDAGRPAAYSYCGPVFRMSPQGSGERMQAGLESFGRLDTLAADAEILALSLEAVERAGTRLTSVSLGDASLVAAMLDAIALPPVFQRRIKRALEHGEDLDVALSSPSTRRIEHSGLLTALAGADGRDAQALVADLLSIAGITAVGGRSVGEIADRFLAQVEDRVRDDVGDERRAVLGAFFAIQCDPDRASSQIRALAEDAKFDLGAALDFFDERIGFIAAYGVDLGRVAFRTTLDLSIDYYTGFMFQAYGTSQDGPVVSGGRYDRLCHALDRRVSIPAVGAAVWLDRLDPETQA